jgi:plasmid stabilization system protein ParE
MRYEFHPEALEEYQEATLYYAQRDPALALRFVEMVVASLATGSAESPHPNNRLETGDRKALAVQASRLADGPNSLPQTDTEHATGA